MIKFGTSAWSTFHKRILQTSPASSQLSKGFSNVFRTACSNFSQWTIHFKSYRSNESPRQRRSFSSSGGGSAQFNPKSTSGAGLFSFFSRKPRADSFQNAFEVEKAISDMVINAEKLVVQDKLTEAKKILTDALKLAEETNVFSNVSSVYDLLSTIAFKEGGITEAEDMLVKFIEKLIQLGYPENHNSVVRFKLKLSRLYQSVGNTNMAELGFRDCINTLEEKLVKSKTPDELTNLIYVSSLFWYGRFLTETGEFIKARNALKKSLHSLSHTKSVSPAQIMVVLYYNAEVAYILKEYDDSLHYLYTAINICKESDPENRDLPLYLVKVGYIHIIKGAYDDARFWCEAAGQIATITGNNEAHSEVKLCLETLDKVMKDPKLALQMGNKNNLLLKNNSG